MRYSFSATVNYPEGSEETPSYEGLDLARLEQIATKLITTEPDATSFVIVITQVKS